MKPALVLGSIVAVVLSVSPKPSAAQGEVAPEPPAIEPGGARTTTVAPPPPSPIRSDDQENDDGEESYVPPNPRELARASRPQYRNPEGSVALSAILYGSFGSGGENTFVFGIGLGYAVVTGVVPGIRAALVTGGRSTGGDVAATLTLTPPVSWNITPFVVGEVGRRFDDIGAWLYGLGGGIYIGEPASNFAFQVGVIFRRIAYPDPYGPFDAYYPIVSVSIRF